MALERGAARLAGVRGTLLRQLVLLGLDPVIRTDAGSGPDGEVSDSRPGDVVAMSVVDERQAALFEDRAVLLRALDHALEPLAFWRCLRVTETPECSDEALHEARRRMKALLPELHNAFMRRVPLGR